MNKIKILLFLLLPVVSFAQTTIEEYNYLTKGYKVQTESGLDMKKGYELKDISTKTTSERKVEVKLLQRIKSNGTKENAAYLVIYQKSGTQKEYICIPHPESGEDVLMSFWNTLYDGSMTNASARLQIVIYSLLTSLKW